MIIDDNNHLLYIEHKSQAPEPAIYDNLTFKMIQSFTAADPPSQEERWRGRHTCACGMKSDNCDYTLPNGMKVNSLCIHYLVHHRSEVPEAEIKKVKEMPEVVPPYFQTNQSRISK